MTSTIQPESTMKNVLKENKVHKIEQKLANYEVFNAEQAPIQFKSLYENRTTIIIFIRHFNCYVCRDFVKCIGQLDLQKEFYNHNLDIKIVGCADKKGIKSIEKEIIFPIKHVVTDPTRIAYKYLDFIEAKNYKEVRGDGVKAKETKTARCCGLLWSCWKMMTRKNMGSIYQLGGTIVVNQKGELLFKFIDHTSEGHFSIYDLKKLVQQYGNKNKPEQNQS